MMNTVGKYPTVPITGRFSDTQVRISLPRRMLSASSTVAWSCCQLSYICTTSAGGSSPCSPSEASHLAHNWLHALPVPGVGTRL